MADVAALLAAYDEHMRMPTGAVPAGVTYEYDGPLLRIVGGHVGRIRAPRDVGVDGAELDQLIVRQRDYFGERGQGVEWKLRAHDLPTDLAERLVAAGFVPEEPSTVLLGVAAEVARAARHDTGHADRSDGPSLSRAKTSLRREDKEDERAGHDGPIGHPDEPVLSGWVVVRRASAAEDLRRFADLQSEVFGVDCSWVADDLASRVAADPEQITILVAEVGERVVCGAFALYAPGTDFVALLGGATVPEWRGRGIYRALIAARAEEAVAKGFRLLHVDASPASAPILRRCGFHAITTARHYQWTPPDRALAGEQS
ncbi:GNAT family N-acetyltransferase [Symbioplanes lichenis]|uniref:GNAT family N-acetyltransferase n=1 Tax=Symbioplanes lichenis TaxID=1629072 RepID=UPI00273A05EA|nr:GNAT family N-acetyltransferase [Actinoplanes lichenis]